MQIEKSDSLSNHIKWLFNILIDFIILILFSVLFFQNSFVLAGTTGKITGRIIDADTKTPLPGANVVVEGAALGAATDNNGYYVILNIPPGKYVLRALMMGYNPMKVVDVKVSTDLTTVQDFALQSMVLGMNEVVIVAERPLIQRDLTASSVVISTETINEMPVEEFSEVLAIQAGTVRGPDGMLHIRGGRASEITYMVDGVSVTDPFANSFSAVAIEKNAIQELTVVSGTFNAEYGQAMSGIVNIVTKEGDERFSGGLSMYSGDYVSGHNKTFQNIDEINPLSLWNVQGSLGGPIPLNSNKLFFFVSGRLYSNEGWLYGKRIYNSSDSLLATGDRTDIPMNSNRKISYQGNLTYRLSSNLKLTYGILGDIIHYDEYSHLFKYNPDGNYHHHQNGYTHKLSLSHTLSSSTFYTLKLYNYFTDYRYYVYEDPHDSRYVDPIRFQVATYNFYQGGSGMWRYCRNSKTWGGKVDITSQVNKVHQLKAGAEIKQYNMYYHAYEIKLDWTTNFQPQIPDLTSLNRDLYRLYPIEASVYIQDKIELQSIVINGGVRYDYFNPKKQTFSDSRNPTNSPSKNSSSKHKISPRVGMAYPITDRGIIHISYGHFFQIPSFSYLYHNPDFKVRPGVLSTTMGNPDLKPEETVIYEIGLQQQLGENLVVDFTGYYKDIKNLLGSKYYQLYDVSRKYTHYINRDYGRVKGFSVSLEKRRSGMLSAGISYTYQIAKGNASDPNEVYYDQRSSPPRETEKNVVYLNWDQRHTLNVSVALNQPKNWGVSLIGSFGSGLPYTPEYQNQRTSFENSGRKPMQLNFDLRAHKDFTWQGFVYSFFVKCYNLFDRKNEIVVFNDTGRASYSLIPQYVADTGVFPLSDYLNFPDYYSEPRRIIVGVGISF